MKPTPTSPAERPFLLAFGAHPDDIEFGCGAIIAQETLAGRPAHLVVCSRGESGTNGTPEERTVEARGGAARLGATLDFADLGGDAHFEMRAAHAMTLAAIIRKFRPSIVLAPTTVENQHPDHVVLGRLVRDAVRLARFGGVSELAKRPAHAVAHLLFYAVTPEAEPKDRSAMLVDVSTPEVLKAWKASMEAHASQAKTRGYTELQIARALVCGRRCGVTHAIPLFPNDPLVFSSLNRLDRAARHF